MQRYKSRDDNSRVLDIMPDIQRWIENQVDISIAYLVTWITFNAIYVAEYDKEFASFDRSKNGQMQFSKRDGYGPEMVKVNHATERDMVFHALKKLPKKVRQQLVTLTLTDDEFTCAEFFANRQPVWQAQSITRDAKGQTVNGVINVRETVSADYPRWAFIESSRLMSVLASLKMGEDVDVPDDLFCQIGDVLYTVRNNLFHGCKGSEDSNDDQVLIHAYPLLKGVVDFFTRR